MANEIASTGSDELPFVRSRSTTRRNCSVGIGTLIADMGSLRLDMLPRSPDDPAVLALGFEELLGGLCDVGRGPFRPVEALRLDRVANHLASDVHGQDHHRVTSSALG